MKAEHAMLHVNVMKNEAKDGCRVGCRVDERLRKKSADGCGEAGGVSVPGWTLLGRMHSVALDAVGKIAVTLRRGCDPTR